MTDCVELVEHGEPVQCALSDALGEALAAENIISAQRVPRQPGQWRLRAQGKVGAVTVRTADQRQALTLRITPKVPIARFFFVLGYRLNPHRYWRSGEVELAEEAGLLPAFAHAVEHRIDRALQRGPLLGYRTVEAAQQVVRGRLRETDQVLRHFGRPVPVEVVYDELTSDISENRILRAAVERLLQLPGVPKDVRVRLRQQRQRLADVTQLPTGQQLPHWQPTRHNARYHDALELCRVVLEEASPEHKAGNLRMDGFLLPMHALFQDFVGVALREALRSTGYTTRLQESLCLDVGGRLPLRPDAVVYGAGQPPIAVVDAKYKKEKSTEQKQKREGGQYPPADLYQLLSYCTALGAPAGHLVYAQGSKPHQVHRVRRAGLALHQHVLNLDQPPDDLLAAVLTLSRHVTTDQ